MRETLQVPNKSSNKRETANRFDTIMQNAEFLTNFTAFVKLHWQESDSLPSLALSRHLHTADFLVVPFPKSFARLR